jgi:O-antigen/teichoic acid export membrane protein
MGVARTVAKNTLFRLISTSSNMLVDFFVGIALTRGLGTEQWGVYSFLMWFLTFAVVAVNLGLGSMVTRFVADTLGRQQTNETGSIIRAAILLRASAAIVVTIVIIVISAFLVRVFTDQAEQFHFILLAFALLPNVLNLLLVAVFAGFQKYEYGAYLHLGTNPLRAVAIIVLMITGAGVQEILILNIAVWCLGVFIGLLLLRRLIPLKSLISPNGLGAATRTSATKYALAVMGVTIVNFFIWRQAEVLFLGIYSPVEEVGFYRLASRIPGTAMAIIPMALSSVLLPAISEQFAKGDTEKLKRIYTTSSRYLMILALPIATAGIALAQPFINIAYGVEYDPSIILMQILFIPFAMWAIADAPGYVIFGVNQPTFILKVGLVLIFLSLGLNYWLIPAHGALGAAIGSSVSRLIAPILYIIYACKITNAKWPLLDTVKILVASGMLCAALFALHMSLGEVPGLILAIPLGIPFYIITISLFRVIDNQDIAIFRGLQEALPHFFRRPCGVIIGAVEKLARTKKTGMESRD